MKSLVLLALLAFLGTCVAMNTTQPLLVCHKCDYPCITESTATCKAGEMCATSKAHKGLHHITKKGCLAQERCSKEEPDKYLNIEYKVFHICCDTALCNKKK
ncbi:uncharacterized protein LOC144756308 [Lissotriton helveticus]